MAHDVEQNLKTPASAEQIAWQDARRAIDHALTSVRQLTKSLERLDDALGRVRAESAVKDLATAMRRGARAAQLG